MFFFCFPALVFLASWSRVPPEPAPSGTMPPPSPPIDIFNRASAASSSASRSLASFRVRAQGCSFSGKPAGRLLIFFLRLSRNTPPFRRITSCCSAGFLILVPARWWQNRREHFKVPPFSFRVPFLPPPCSFPSSFHCERASKEIPSFSLGFLSTIRRTEGVCTSTFRFLFG